MSDKILLDMGGDVAVLPADVEGLQRLVVQLQHDNTVLRSRAEVLEDELRLLRHKIFGRRSERFSVEELQQSSLFDEAEVAIEENVRKLAEPTIEVSAHRRRTPGRKPLPADLPREDESVRDYLRMYEDTKVDLKRVKQRLLHFLLRRGLNYKEGTNWTAKHKRWIRSLEMEHAIDQETFSEYLCQIEELEEKCHRIAARIEELSEEEKYRDRVATLKAFKGVQTLTALSLLVEIGDFKRFVTADQFMAFLGLVPSDRSSGNKRRIGGITKAGNSHLRKLLVEAAWHYRSYHSNSLRLNKRRVGLEAQLVSYANRAGRRLNRKYLRLVFKGKCSQVAATAVARELCGFIWGAMLGKVA